MRRVIAAAFLAVMVMVAAGQTWVSRYNGSANDEDQAYGLGRGDSGRVFVTGTSWATGTGNDVLTIGYGQSGESLWAQRFDGSAHSDDLSRAIAVAGGRVAVTGGTTGASALTDMLTIAYDAAGTQQWSAVYDAPAAGNDHGLALAIDSSGNTYSAGYMTGDTTGWNFAVLKYNSSGSRQWVGTYSTMDEDYVSAVAVDAAGNVYAAGNSGSPYTLSWDYVTARYNVSTGDTIWVRRLNGTADEDDEIRAMAVDNGGNVIVTGGSTNSGTGVDYTTVKYGSSGDTMWVRRYNGTASGTDWAYAVAVDASNNVYVTGSSQDTATDMDYVTVKYDASGNQQWVARYDGPAHSFDEARAITVDASDNVYVTGGSIGSGTRTDYATVRYNASTGNEAGVNRYDGPANRIDEAVAVVLDGSGGVVVTGGSVGSGTGTDYATIRYGEVGVEETPSAEVRTPNGGPTIVHGILNLQSATCNLQSAIVLLDASGRKVATLQPGANDVSCCTPGVYFVLQVSGAETVARRVVIAE
jgi:hypothetical protein